MDQHVGSGEIDAARVTGELGRVQAADFDVVRDREPD
jgi:hypothetical protein